jgi:inosine-uridine nucleoside N-ribohydrolase
VPRPGSFLFRHIPAGFRPLLAIAILSTALLHAAPVRIIFDTDIGNDIDDALALAMLHAMESRGEVKLLAVTISKDNRYAGPFVSLINAFYHRPGIPLGTVRDGKSRDDGNYLRPVVESGFYPHSLADSQQAPDAVTVLRKTLASEKDHSVVIVQVGFSTNLARLLDSKPDTASMLAGSELVRRKVRVISAMAGHFPTGPAEYNVKIDIEAARKLVSESPVPIVFSGFEIGKQILYPATSIEHDYAYVAHHPVADAYRAYQPMPYDRPAWDLTAVIYAVHPSDSFGLSPKGFVSVDDRGVTAFTADKNGRHQFLTVTPDQARRALALMMELSSRPPDRK